jgi:hypothetical protein
MSSTESWIWGVDLRQSLDMASGGCMKSTSHHRIWDGSCGSKAGSLSVISGRVEPARDESAKRLKIVVQRVRAKLGRHVFVLAGIEKKVEQVGAVDRDQALLILALIS